MSTYFIHATPPYKWPKKWCDVLHIDKHINLVTSILTGIWQCHPAAPALTVRIQNEVTELRTMTTSMLNEECIHAKLYAVK